MASEGSFYTHEEAVEMVVANWVAQLCGHATNPLVIGEPGIGKTHMIQAAARALARRGVPELKGMEVQGHKINWENPKVHVHTIMLSQGDNVDIGGAFAPDFKKGELVHILTKDILGDVRGAKDADVVVIFFDELANGGTPALSALQSYIEDWVIRGHKKLPHTVLAFATNLPEHGCNAKPLPRSILEGRVCSIHMQPDTDGWINKWAAENDIDPRIIAAINWKNELLHKFDGRHKGRTQRSMRGWEKLSRVMDTGVSGRALEGLIEGWVGKEAAVEFNGFLSLGGRLATFEQISEDPEGAVMPGDEYTEEGPSGQYITASVVASKLRTMKRNDIHVETRVLENIIKYFGRMSDEIGLYALKLCEGAYCEIALNKEFSKMQLELQALK